VIRVCTPPDLPAARLKGAAARTHLQPHITERDTPPRPRTSLTTPGRPMSMALLSPVARLSRRGSTHRGP